MERDYANGKKSSVEFFVGYEVEKTPAFGLKTLFVTGIQPVGIISGLVAKHACEHVYLGANMSFDPGDWQAGHHRLSDAWDKMIKDCLGVGIYITLDFDVMHCEWVHEGGYSENNNFIPQISVKLPYIGLFNYNTTLKIDDKAFNATNPGVWCHGLHELQSRTAYTDWQQYKKDQPL